MSSILSYITLKKVCPSWIRNGTSCGRTSKTTWVPCTSPLPNPNPGSKNPAGRFERNHFSRIPRGYTYPFLRGKNIEFLRFQQETPLTMPIQRFPKVEGGVITDFREVD